ncbi:MAG: S1 family peptidase [Candidatus Flexifilum sp.]
MSAKILDMGIRALQAGSRAEGIRLIRIALKQNALPAELRAIAYLWLAETSGDAAERVRYLGLAVSADPNNADARARLAQALTPDPTPPPVTLPETGPLSPPHGTPQPGPAAAAAPPGPASRVNAADYVARIIGGPAGAGTGVLLDDGFVATTRHIVGSLERLTVEFHGVGQMPAVVVRSSPELDLALLRVDHRVPTLIPITPLARVPDDAPLTAVSFTGAMIEGRQRPTRRAMAAHWIPTTITRLPDAGGDLLFDEQLYLVGLLTDNTSRTSEHRFGLHISAIRHALDALRSETRERRRYCSACGSASRAGGAGLYYCEICGATLPEAVALQRQPIAGAEAYYPRGARCARCGGEAGFYGGHCLRCGADKS